MSTEFELFPGKSLGGLFKDIYDNQQTKKLRISELIAEMRKLVRHSQDMMAMGPIIRDLIDSSVRNDDSLIKMAAIAQRIIGNNQKSEGDSGFLSNDEKEQLLKELDQTISEVSNEHDIKLDDITNEVEELKLKVGKNE
jgi:hypothetical protein|tara:strand:- start:459 stop:875 length:417 start_codon:yes stop_codon:yes gene_type:complete